VVVGIIAIINLLLTIGVIRRLREHTALLSQQPRSDSMPPVSLPGPGTRIGEFTATTVSGAAVNLDADGDGSLVGFFSPGCKPCEKLMPEFVDYASGIEMPVLAVIVGNGSETPAMIAALEKVATVVHEDNGGTVSDTFGISGFPSVLLVGAGRTVRASGHDLTAVRQPVRA
jgi:hypothetical protein